MSFADTLRERGETIVYAFALLYFAIEASWFALNIHPFVPPDEVTHVGRIIAFSKSWLPPDDGPATWELGLVSRVPTLYYYAMGRVAWLIGADVIALRLCNVALGVATVAIGIAWVRLPDLDEGRG